MKRALLAAMAALLVAASPADDTRHTVRDGETLNGIANRAGVSPAALAEANKLTPPYAVRVGQVLVIPRGAKRASAPASKPASSSSGSTYVVKDGETLNGIANRAGVSPAALAAANKLTPPYAVRVGQRLTLPRRNAAAAPAAKPAGGSPASAPAPTTSALRIDTETSHVVKPGETFNGIAIRTGIPRSVLAQANGLTAPYVVKVGQTLRIPRQRTHVVAEGETGFGIAFKYGVPYDDILTANGLGKDAVIKTGQKLVIPAMVQDARAKEAAKASQVATEAAAAARAAATDGGFRWPLTGKVITRFDAQAGHRGIDIDATLGQAVTASKAGKVIYAGEEPVRYGKVVVLEHEGQWYSAYAHLLSIGVAKGETVKAGDVVGRAGSSGEATQPQLHFELRQANRPVDPLTKLP